MKLNYYLKYDSNSRSLLAEITDPMGLEVFTVDTPEFMVELIEADELEYLDDVKGMERYLKQEGIIEHADYLVLRRG